MASVFPFDFSFLFLKVVATLTLNLASMIGKKMVRHLTPSLPMVTTQQHATEVNPPINRETGGLEELRTDPPRQLQQEEYREMVPREHLLPRPLRSQANTSPS